MTKEKKFAIDLAKKAGKIIKENFGKSINEEWKKDFTPLTKTDIKINQLVIDSVKKQFPSHSVLSEEGSFFVKNGEYTWVCDPLDGTIAFCKKVPVSTFVLALVKNGESILGLVYDPFLDRMFIAEKGKGAYLNGKKISVSSINALKRAVVGFNWRRVHKFNILNVFGALKQQNTLVLSLGSSAYTGGLVGCGNFEAYISAEEKCYEAAALKVIVEEAGGRVTDIFGKDQRYDKEIKGFLVSNGILHQKFVDLIKKSIK